MTDNLLDLPQIRIHFDLFEGELDCLSPAGHTTGWRLRPDALLTHNEESRLLCKIEGCENFCLEHGEMAFIPPGLRNELTIVGAQNQRCTWCHMNFTAFESISLLTLFDLKYHWKGEQAAKLKWHCERMLTDARCEAMNPYLRSAKVQETGMAILSLLLTEASPKPQFHDITANIVRLEPALHFMRQHLSERVTVSDLAERVHLSRSRFADVFTKTLGQTPLRYLAQLRLATAARLLNSSDQEIREVGQQCGYPDPFHFSRTFKAEYGMSPTEYRESNPSGMPLA